MVLPSGIEGSSLSEEEVARLIENMDITQLISRDQQEVAGYYRVLDILQEQYGELTLSETLIKGLHNELMRFSSKDNPIRLRALGELTISVSFLTNGGLA